MPLPKTRFCLLLSLFSAAPATAHDPKPTTEEIAPEPQSEAAGVLDAFHDAVRTGDLLAAAARLDEDALIFESGGAERSRAEYVDHHLPADAAFAAAVTRAVLRRSEGQSGHLAWIATESRTVGEFKGRPIDSVGTETAVLKRDEGQWRIVHLHWSSAR